MSSRGSEEERPADLSTSPPKAHAATRNIRRLFCAGQDSAAAFTASSKEVERGRTVEVRKGGQKAARTPVHRSYSIHEAFHRLLSEMKDSGRTLARRLGLGGGEAAAAVRPQVRANAARDCTRTGYEKDIAATLSSGKLNITGSGEHHA